MFVWFQRISSSKFQVFPYMETELPYIEVSQNLNFFYLRNCTQKFSEIFTLILIHKNLLSLKIHSFYSRPYHLTEYFKMGIAGMGVEKEEFCSKVSLSWYICLYRLAFSSIFLLLIPKSVRWFNFWKKCLTIFKIQISLTLFIMGENFVPGIFSFSLQENEQQRCSMMAAKKQCIFDRVHSWILWQIC